MKGKITIVTLLFVLLSIGCTNIYNNNAATNDAQLKNEAKKFNALANQWLEQKMPDSAFCYYNASQKLYLEAKDSALAAENLFKMAGIQLASGDYPGSEESVINALSVYKNPEDTTYLCKIYKHLGATHKQLFNYDKAVFYYKKANDLEKDAFELLKLKSITAKLYILKNDYITALKVLKNTQASPVLDHDPLIKADVLDYNGYASFKTDDNNGLAAMNQALGIRQYHDDLNGTALSYLHLSEYYTISDPENARLCALKAYSIAWQSSNQKRKLDCLIRLIAVSTGKDANMYLQHYGILKNETDRTTQAIENKFKKLLTNGNPKVNIIENTARLETSKDNNKILTLALMASVFSSVLLFYQLTQRHKKERLLDAYAAETRLSKKIHDEIANELYGTLHYIEHEDVVSGSKKEKLIEQLDNIYLMTRNISRENNDIDTGLRFPVQLKLMLATYADSNVNVIVKGISKINWDKIESIKKIATYRVLQELMVNMSKHSKATVVLIDFNIDKSKVKIIYSDNGIGAACNTLNLKNGLQNVENRMVSIGGSISFDTKSEKGFHLTLTYPLPILYV